MLNMLRATIGIAVLLSPALVFSHGEHAVTDFSLPARVRGRRISTPKLRSNGTSGMPILAFGSCRLAPNDAVTDTMPMRMGMRQQ